MTAQVADRILIEGREYALFSEPLRDYLIVESLRFLSPHTALWRGYVAKWEIADGRLFLLAVGGSMCTVQDDKARAASEYQHRHDGPCVIRDVGLEDLFPGSNGRVFAEWVTGRLRIPQGKLLEYVHMGFESVYERNLIVDVDHGVVTNTAVVKTPKAAKRWMFWKRRR